ncbi:hypothetical protein ES288_A08G154600v1 [Gossypium darwinii]|uniref:Uncharacterized protein n=1 Tax=Gossypium darwinii TaxID=34276 RepID=A0A5D2FLQ8_GOSDA|nr:hypothetical protein ES288_A08G154600v1 [Gossypium darwinii]
MATMQQANDLEISKHTSLQDAINDGNGRSSEKLMFDLVCVKTKGSRNSRMKSQFEKKKNKEGNALSRKQNKSLMHEGSPIVPLPMESQTYGYSSYHQIPMLMTLNYHNHFFHPLQVLIECIILFKCQKS